MHLTLNLSLTLRDRSLLDAIAAADEAGFRNIEFWWPSVTALAGASLEDVAASIRERGLTVDLINVPSGDMAAGDREIAADPDRTVEFRRGVEAALTFAEALGAKKVNALAGKVLPGQHPADAAVTALDNIAWAADRARERDISVVIEPLNEIENAGYVWPTVAALAKAIGQVERAGIGVLLDVYHVAMAGQDVPSVIRDCPAPIGHVQLADHPGRHEPGTGTLSFPDIIASLRPVYSEGLGIECVPSSADAPDFALIRAMLAGI